jgi:hypothetical protein
MNLIEQGFRVDYEDRSLALPRRPSTPAGLMRQRFRWSFGTLQAVWKHRAAFIRNKAMGLFALPNIIVFQMFLPLVSPFIDIMFLYGVANYFVDRSLPPAGRLGSASFEKLLVFFLGFLLIDFVTSSVAFSLEAKAPRQQGRRLAAVPHLAAALRLPPGLFGRLIQDREARHRRQALQLGQNPAHRPDEQAHRSADGNAVAAIARLAFNENYSYVPMAHRVEVERGNIESAEFSWGRAPKRSSMRIQTKGEGFLPPEGSLSQFITEHYWGYAAQADGGCLEYEVQHPRWRVWAAQDAQFSGNGAWTYEAAFAKVLAHEPDSAFVAEGSTVTVSKGTRLD